MPHGESSRGAGVAARGVEQPRSIDSRRLAKTCIRFRTRLCPPEPTVSECAESSSRGRSLSSSVDHGAGDRIGDYGSWSPAVPGQCYATNRAVRRPAPRMIGSVAKHSRPRRWPVHTEALVASAAVGRRKGSSASTNGFFRGAGTWWSPGPPDRGKLEGRSGARFDMAAANVLADRPSESAHTLVARDGGLSANMGSNPSCCTRQQRAWRWHCELFHDAAARTHRKGRGLADPAGRSSRGSVASAAQDS